MNDRQFVIRSRGSQVGTEKSVDYMLAAHGADRKRVCEKFQGSERGGLAEYCVDLGCVAKLVKSLLFYLRGTFL